MNIRTDLILPALFALLSATCVMGMEPGPGQASCKAVDTDCYISWNLTNDPKKLYRVERFEPVSMTWHSELETSSPNDVSDSAAVPGHLYRVYGCNDNQSESKHDCVSTTVYWSPVIPNAEDEIPERMFDSNGQGMRISKDVPLRTQILTYNVYLFVQAIGRVDMTALPAMTEPPGKLETLADIVHDNVYANYVAAHDAANGIFRDPGPERKDAGPLHPVNHPSHKSDHKPEEDG